MGLLNLFKNSISSEPDKNKSQPLERQTIEIKVNPHVKSPAHSSSFDLDEELVRLNKELAEDDAILKRRCAAESRFESDGDVESFLNFWRDLWDEGTCFRIRGSWLYRYPELLIKEKRYDEAWGALNRMYLERPYDAGKIRNLQFSLLKKEGKRPKDAIFYLMASVLLRLQGIYEPSASFNNYYKEQFIKKAKPVAKKAGFSETELEYLAYLIESAISSNQFSEDLLLKSYKKFLLDFESRSTGE